MTEEPSVLARTECGRCGEVRTCRLVEDPFLSEVYPEYGPYPREWWCDDCFYDRKDEV